MNIYTLLLISIKYFLDQEWIQTKHKISRKWLSCIPYLYIKIHGTAKAKLIGKCIGLSNYINKNERLKINTRFKKLEIVHKVSSRDLKFETKKVKNRNNTSNTYIKKLILWKTKQNMNS